MEFWIEKGVIGFRFDALKHLYESETFEDEPFIKGKENSTNYDDLKHTLTCDQPETIEIIYKWRKFLEDYKTKKNSSFTT